MTLFLPTFMSRRFAHYKRSREKDAHRRRIWFGVAALEHFKGDAGNVCTRLMYRRKRWTDHLGKGRVVDASHHDIFRNA